MVRAGWGGKAGADLDEAISQIHKELTATFLSGKTRPIAFRKEQIKKLGFLVQDNEQAFADALRKDLGRPEGETLFGETAVMKVRKPQCDDPVKF